MATAAYAASGIFAAIDISAATFENIAPQITGLTSDNIVSVP
jgi:hypothetical protein